MTRLLRHLRPFAALCATLLIFGGTQAAGPTLDPAQAYDQANAGKLTLIDIRTPSEWEQTGVAPIAHRIDMQDPAGPDGFADKVLAELHGDRTAPVALICRSGNRSGRMQKELSRRGFTNVYSVQEGMSGSSAGPGWIERGLPTQPCPDC